MRALGNAGGDHCHFIPDQDELMYPSLAMRVRHGYNPGWISNNSLRANGYFETLQSYLNSFLGSLSNWGF